MEPFAFDQLEAPGGVASATTASGRAAEIVARAAGEASSIRLAAAAAGREEGFAAGLAEARTLIGPGTEALRAAAAAVGEACDAFLETAERRAVELALALAEKIVGEAIAADPDLVLGAVAGALRAAGERDHLVAEVNPEDFEVVNEAVADLSRRVGGVHRLEVVAERRVPRGGCVVRTTEGEIDARVAEKLALAGEVLADALASRGADA